MTFEIATTEFMGISQEHIIVNLGNEQFKSFPVDENNPEYQSFKKELEKQNSVD